jgi:hypothetical protein
MQNHNEKRLRNCALCIVHLPSPVEALDPRKERILIDQPAVAGAMRGGLEGAVLAHLDQPPSRKRGRDDAVLPDEPFDLRKAEFWARRDIQ